MKKSDKKRVFTPDELAFMKETYGRILTPEEWEERAKRFTSGPEDLSYNEDGILRV
jgi:hypothetical protein